MNWLVVQEIAVLGLRIRYWAIIGVIVVVILLGLYAMRNRRVT
jgi:hypothetical protein